MDDNIASVPKDEQGIALYKQLSQLCHGAGMHARRNYHNCAMGLECMLEEIITTVQWGWNACSKKLSQLCNGAGMHARKFLSNSPVLLNEIPPENRASEIDLKGFLRLAAEDTLTFKGSHSF